MQSINAYLISSNVATLGLVIGAAASLYSGSAVAGCDPATHVAKLSSAKPLVISLAAAGPSDAGAWSGAESRKIVGYWRVQSLDGQGNVLDLRFDNYFDDHNELYVDTTPPIAGNTCNGTWVQSGRTEYKLLHLTWAFDSTNTIAIGYAALRDVITLDKDEQSFSGTETAILYDLNGNVQAAFGPFELKATRVKVDF